MTCHKFNLVSNKLIQDLGTSITYCDVQPILKINYLYKINFSKDYHKYYELSWWDLNKYEQRVQNYTFKQVLEYKCDSDSFTNKSLNLKNIVNSQWQFVCWVISGLSM